ncbi:O-antigen ligase family protein [Chloroflexi bacterium TSY]|nr:O-antigen ligase family protein [Chloroflexi bacterium TSY]
MRSIALWLSLGLIFSIPWENSVSLAGLGSGARLIGLGATACWLGVVLLEGGMRRLRPLHLFTLLFILWNIVSTLWSQNPDRTLVRIQTYAQIFVLLLLVWDLYTTPRSIRLAMQAYVLGGYVSMVSTLFNYFGAVGYRGGVRFTARGFDPNDMSMLLAMGIPMAWYLASANQASRLGKILRIVNLIYIPGAVLAGLLAASRTSLIAILIAFVYILLGTTQLRPAFRLVIAVLLLCSLYLIQPLIPITSIDRLSTTSQLIVEGTFSGRTRIWLSGLETFIEHPLVGIGSGAFRSTVEVGRAPHNIFIAILTETGIIGLVLFLFVLVVVVNQVLRHPTWRNRGIWLALLFVWFIGAIALNWEYRKITWLFFGLSACSLNVFYREDRSVAPEEQGAKIFEPSTLLSTSLRLSNTGSSQLQDGM